MKSYNRGIRSLAALELISLQFFSYEDEVLPSKIRIDPKVLSNFLTSFHCSEITWSLNEDGAQFRNFSDLVDDNSGLRSEVYVDKHELIDYEIESNTDITFCLAELRTILSFAEHINSQIEIMFSGPGRPMFLIVRSDVLTAHVVLSTLGLSNTISTAAPQTQSSNQSQSQHSTNNIEHSDKAADDVLKRVLKRPKYDITKLPGYDKILAPDSDEETQ